MTEALFKKRRNGWVFAKKQLADRLQINKNLHYGHTADLFAYAMFCLLIAPAWKHGTQEISLMKWQKRRIN